MTEYEKMIQVIYKAIGEGMAKFIKYSLAYFTMITVIAGLLWALLAVDRHHSDELKAFKAEIKEYSTALKEANRLLIEAQAERQICLTELGRMAADVAELRAEVRLLKQKR